MTKDFYSLEAIKNTSKLYRKHNNLFETVFGFAVTCESVELVPGRKAHAAGVSLGGPTSSSLLKC